MTWAAMPELLGNNAKCHFEKMLDERVRSLKEDPSFTVWRLVISIFGDFVVPNGEQVAASFLSEIFKRAEVKEGTLRVALSRLVKNEWLTRRREGRLSIYSLGIVGREHFENSVDRINVPSHHDWDGSWSIAVMNPSQTAKSRGEVSQLLEHSGLHEFASGTFVGRTVDVCDEMWQQDSQFLRFSSVNASATTSRKISNEVWNVSELNREYERFFAIYSRFLGTIDGPGFDPNPISALVLRSLMLNDYQRIALAHPSLHDDCLPGNWMGREARALASAIFVSLYKKSEPWVRSKILHGSSVSPLEGVGTMELFSPSVCGHPV